MPPARHATSTARPARSKPASREPRPRGLTTRPLSRIKWDRKFRTVMLGVLALVGWIGGKAVLDVISTHTQAEQQLRLVSELAAQNHRLEQEQQSLSQPATIARDARALGMVRVGERAYVVTGLPGN